MKCVKAFLGAILLVATFDVGFLNELTPTCDGPDPDVCEFDVKVERKYTNMEYYEEGNVTSRMYPLQALEPGILLRMDCDGLPETEINPRLPEGSKAPSVEGTIKLAYMMNGQIPGPAIVVYKGQEIVLRVNNQMLNEAVTIHFHGIAQQGTPWMDGVSGVSQCPINPGETFTYRFKPEEVGTFYYHAHLGTQRTEGLYAPLVIMDRPESLVPDSLTFDKEFYMVVTDWFKESSFSMSHRFQYGGVGYKLPTWQECWIYKYRQYDGCFISFDPFYAALINGKGWRYEESTENLLTPNYPLETFYVTKGQKYRFRAISAASMFPFSISIDGHTLYVIASDGYDVEPVAVQSIIINSGERYDFYIEANDPDDLGEYWIRVATTDLTFASLGNILRLYKVDGTHVEGILRYGPTSKDYSLPTSSPDVCTTPGNFIVLNCPFERFPLDNCKKCITLTDLRSTKHQTTFPMEENSIESIINTVMIKANPSIQMVYPTIGGIANIKPTKPPMMYPSNWTDSAVPCDSQTCDSISGLCKCTHLIKYPTNTTVQMVLTNYHYDVSNITNSPYNHPVHIHGVHFQVVKYAYPQYDDDGIYYFTNKDLKCVDNNLCTEVVWADPDMAGGNVPDMLTSGAPIKDTVLVPAGGYVVIRFRTENPGYWYFHCHMEQHNTQGMALIMQVGEPEEMPPAPPGMPQCGDFTWDGKPTLVKIEEVSVVTASSQVVTQIVIIIVLALLCLFLLVIVVLQNRRYSEYTKF